MAKLRIAVITDIHNGPDTGSKYGSKAPRLLDAFVKAANRAKADLVVDMGDRITAGNAADARARMQTVKDYFNRLSMPSCDVTGNHDIKQLDRAENQAIMGSSAWSHSHDVKGVHLVFWNPGDEHTLFVTQRDIDWLRDDLAAAVGKPAVVFTHVPLDLDAKDFEGPSSGDIAGRFLHSQSPVIRDVIRQSGSVVLCMAGHRHRKHYQQIDGVHYLQQQSLTNAWQKKYRMAEHAWSLIDIDDDKITVRLRDRSPMRMNGKMVKKFVLPINRPPVIGALPQPSV